jgi:uncharacterized membrane protein YesL
VSADHAQEAQMLARRTAYLDAYRGAYRREQTIGLVLCLLGALVLVAGRFRAGAPHWLVWVGAVVIAVGWLLFTYVIVRRTQWVRTHPFDPNGQSPTV